MESRQDGIPGTTRSRRGFAESGSFGKSTRRSRSRTGTPARRENPTLAAADKIFGDWVSSQASASTAGGGGTSASTTTPQRKSSSGVGSSSNPDDPSSAAARQTNVPTEMILRGYKSAAQQYAAINHYEQLAGRICEDYPREPPPEQRRYKSELRDPAIARSRGRGSRPLTPDERARVNRADGGEHWVKITFESVEAADAASFASPQRVLGYLVFAEPYKGMAPARDEAVPDVEALATAVGDHARSRSAAATDAPGTPRGGGRTDRTSRAASSFPAAALATPSLRMGRLGDLSASPPESRTSSQTLDTGTLTASSATVLEPTTATTTPGRAAGSGIDLGPRTPRNKNGDLANDEDSIFCRRIPTARKAQLLPADQALLPQPSYAQRMLNNLPFLKWFSGSMIGNEVPRTDAGDFDYNRASLYWKFIYWLDSWFSLFGGEIVTADKDD